MITNKWSKDSGMTNVKKKKKTMKKKKASNVSLVWDKEEDRPAITSLQEIAKEFGVDGTEALRRTCVYAKEYMIEKAKAVKELLKAS